MKTSCMQSARIELQLRSRDVRGGSCVNNNNNNNNWLGHDNRGYHVDVPGKDVCC